MRSSPNRAVAVLLLLSACVTTAPDSRSDLASTWEEATVVLPAGAGGAPLVAKMGDPALVDRGLALGTLPTVVYLHGCTGLGNRRFLERLAEAGFAVIAPDSLARSYRPLQCDPRSKAGGFNLFVYDFRLAEISYALHRLGELDWVDTSNLFLIGTSEGGVAAALYRGDEFNARVIAQWTCTGAAIVRGLAAPPGEPVLAVVNGDDPWYAPDRTPGQRGDCGAFMAGRPDSRSIVLRGEGEHWVFDDEATLQTILAFLARHRRGGAGLDRREIQGRRGRSPSRRGPRDGSGRRPRSGRPRRGRAR